MKKYFCAIILLMLSGCFMGDEAHDSTKLVKNFWLKWWGEKSDKHILLSDNETGNGGVSVIQATVFAVGFNEQFIIAKQHPDMQNEIQLRLFNYDSIVGAYTLENVSDTVWLSNEDSIFKRNNNWYHISNGWNPPDSLKPYKAITYYHIVDIRNYNAKQWNSYKDYKYDNELDFWKKRKELGVPENLNFTIFDSQLK